MTRHLAALFLTLGIAAAPSAAGTATDPIDQALDACLEKADSTASMVGCSNTAYTAWDKELNRVYAELMGALTDTQKTTLRAAQRAWLNYRDAELKLIDGIYAETEGTMYVPMRADHTVTLIKQRVLDLRRYLAIVKGP